MTSASDSDKANNPYASPHSEPSAQQPRHTVGSVFWVVVAVGWAMLMVFKTIAARIKFNQMFADFELTVPGVTLLALSPITPVLLTMVVIGLVVKEFMISDREVANKFNRRALLVLFLFGLAYMAVLLLPLVSVHEQLSG